MLLLPLHFKKEKAKKKKKKKALYASFDDLVVTWGGNITETASCVFLVSVYSSNAIRFRICILL